MQEISLPSQRIFIRNNLNEIPRVVQMIGAFLARLELSSSLSFDFSLAADELLTNVITYGFEDEQAHDIQVQIRRTDKAIVLCIEDDGRAYDPTQARPPDLAAGLMERSVGGLGIHLVRQFMDHLAYHRENEKNVLILTKNLPSQKGTQTHGMHRRETK